MERERSQSTSTDPAAPEAAAASAALAAGGDGATGFAASLLAAADVVRRGQRFLVTAHARLDGDAIGAMLVTAHGLRRLGKDVYLYNADPVPRRLQFLPGAGEIRRKLPAALRCDAALVHDCGARHLLGEHFPDARVTGPLVVLDHHEVVSDLGDLVLRDAHAASAGVIAWRLLAALGLDEAALPRDLATALFVSLVEDTGWFRYPGTNPEALRLAGACVQAGVSTWEIALLLDESLSEASLRLLCQVLPSLERHAEGRLAILMLTDQMMRDADAAPDDVGKLVNYARAVRGVEVGALITVSDERIYVSLRGKGAVHLGEVAQRFGGGGHKNAAGCTIPLGSPASPASPTSLGPPAPPDSPDLPEPAGPAAPEAAAADPPAPETGDKQARLRLAKQQLIDAVTSALAPAGAGPQTRAAPRGR
jgi:phosphoesterase RecJ-like protein